MLQVYPTYNRLILSIIFLVGLYFVNKRDLARSADINWVVANILLYLVIGSSW